MKEQRLRMWITPLAMRNMHMKNFHEESHNGLSKLAQKSISS
jgi:hypothetical protein